MSDCTKSYFKSQQKKKDNANSKICSNTSISVHEYVNKNKYDYAKPLLLNEKCEKYSKIANLRI